MFICVTSRALRPLRINRLFSSFATDTKALDTNDAAKSNISAVTKPAEQQLHLIYESPFIRPLKRLKQISVGGATAACLSAPLLVMLSDGVGSQWPLTVRLCSAGIVMLTGMGSTAGLSYLLRPYATRICVQNEPLSDSLIDRLLQQCDRQPNDGTDKRDEVLLTVELMDWRGRKRVVSNVPANCLQAVGANTARPMVTWQVTGPNNNTVPYIYVHREIMMDNPLLARFCQWLDLSVNCKR